MAFVALNMAFVA